jgi:signal transduction histidine kinase
VRERKIVGYAALLIAVAAHVLAYIEYRALGTSMVFPRNWERDFLILLSLSLVFALIHHTISGYLVRSIAITLRIIIVNLIGVPFAEYLLIEQVLLFSLFIDTNLTYSLPYNLVLSALLIVGTVLIMTFYQVVAVKLSLEVVTNFFPTILLSLFAIAVSGLIRFILDALERERKSSETLNSAVQQLTDANTSFLNYASQVKQKSTIDERKRITRDLHDVVGQVFTNVISMMDAVLKHPIKNEEERRKLHQWVRDHSQKGLKETRAVLYRLRSIEDRSVEGIQAVQNLISTFSRATRVGVRVEWGNLPWKLESSVDATLYRIVQESMINSFRHGKATQIGIFFWVGGSRVSLRVDDNGRGSSNHKMGIGQMGMRERVEALGGSITFQNTAEGYSVFAAIPDRSAVDSINEET